MFFAWYKKYNLLIKKILLFSIYNVVEKYVIVLSKKFNLSLNEINTE